MSFHLRAPIYPSDYPRMAELLSAASMKPVTAAELEENDRDLPEGSLLHRRVAVDLAGQVVGFGEAFRYPNTKVGKFYVNAVVDPSHRGRGLGSALLALSVTTHRTR